MERIKQPRGRTLDERIMNDVFGIETFFDDGQVCYYDRSQDKSIPVPTGLAREHWVIEITESILKVKNFNIEQYMNRFGDREYRAFISTGHSLEYPMSGNAEVPYVNPEGQVFEPFTHEYLMGLTRYERMYWFMVLETGRTGLYEHKNGDSARLILKQAQKAHMDRVLKLLSEEY